MTTNKFIPAKTIQKQYKNIEYLATNGEWYLLYKAFPFCIGVENDDYSVCLDTGGKMSEGYFDIFKMTTSHLYRKGKKINQIRGLNVSV